MFSFQSVYARHSIMGLEAKQDNLVNTRVHSEPFCYFTPATSPGK